MGEYRDQNEVPNGIPHSVRQPTEENLRRDAASIAAQIEGMWEFEVECVVVLVPRAKELRLGTRVPYATTFRDPAKYRAALEAIRDVRFNVLVTAGRT